MTYIDIKQKEKPQKSRGRITAAVGLLLTMIIVGLALSGKLNGIFNPISVVANVVSPNLKDTDGRTNILILGLDKRHNGTVTSVLTDTILIASVSKVDKNAVLISVPRDLWVEQPSGGFSKINAVYTSKGPEELRKIIETSMGVPIHYYSVVTFDMFEQVIDILDGVDINVETAFTDYEYPIEGKENAPINERYETLHFEAGIQNMDGKTALKFARSRKGNNNEGTDFARAKRQHKVILAIKDKALSTGILANPSKIIELYNSYAKNVETDVDISAVQAFLLLAKDFDFKNITSVVLDDRSTEEEGGLLYAPQDTSLYGGAYVLIPKAGDYTQIRAYVQKYLFSTK